MKREIINDLKKIIIEGINELNEEYQAINLLPYFYKIYGRKQIKMDIKAALIYQTENHCFYETVKEKWIVVAVNDGLQPDELSLEEFNAVQESRYEFPDDEIIEELKVDKLIRINITRENLNFDTKNDIVENAYNILYNYTDYDLINQIELFTNEAAKNISGKYTISVDEMFPDD